MTVNNKMTSDALEQEMLRFQGVWKQTGYEVDGIDDAQDDFGAEALTTISGNQFVVNDADGRVLIEGRFTIDPGQIPKAIDWTDTFGEDAGKTFPAIYALEDNKLVFCAADEGQPRPTEFRTREGLVLRVLERIARADT